MRKTKAYVEDDFPPRSEATICHELHMRASDARLGHVLMLIWTVWDAPYQYVLRDGNDRY